MFEVLALTDDPIVFEPLVLSSTAEAAVPWAQNVWRSPAIFEIASISDAAKKLRAVQRNWIPFSLSHHRRTQLISEALPHVSRKPLSFPSPPPAAPLGAFVLLEPGLVLASSETSSPFPNGEVAFIEEREAPPSRAYLKLWETFTRLGRRPGPEDRCLDAGASPGGWTWVLATLGASVLAVDRAPLDSAVARLPGVSSRIGDALSIDPAERSYDWVVSDVAATPERLLPWVMSWIESGAAKNLVVTLKFKGAGSAEVVRRYLELPAGWLFHGFHNKHELTFVWPRAV
ncbi:MAG: hypothetical protein HY791_28835 [Deltaproteobacteria bacterium]|nr:hypothetical protein [Deltaproteobacteria bacterium]